MCDPIARGAAEQPGREDRFAQRVQDAGDVEALAAGAFGDRGDPVGAVRHEGVDRVGQVEGRVQGDGDDHAEAPKRICPASGPRTTALANRTAGLDTGWARSRRGRLELIERAGVNSRSCAYGALGMFI